MTEKQAKRRSPTMSAARIARAVGLMTQEYGPFPAERRLPPTDEMVFTILSQHTSDINSGRAFARLMERFGSLEAVAQGDVSEIEKAIAPGGLAKIKAPRIKEVLEKVLELNGCSLDLSVPARDATGRGESLAQAVAGNRAKVGRDRPQFLAGHAGDGNRHPHISGMPAASGHRRKTNADKAHDVMEAKVPPKDVFNFHVAFINHGRRVCRAQRPLCGECVVGEMCPSRRELMAKMSKSENGARAARSPKLPPLDRMCSRTFPPYCWDPGEYGYRLVASRNVRPAH